MTRQNRGTYKVCFTHLQALVALAVIRLGRESFGKEVAVLIKRMTNNYPTLQTYVYQSLYRMVDNGWLLRFTSDGRPYYKLSPSGRAILDRTIDEIHQMAQMARRILRQAESL
jgi:DNA-binding PadR family transcriptional regulator